MASSRSPARDMAERSLCDEHRTVGGYDAKLCATKNNRGDPENHGGTQSLFCAYFFAFPRGTNTFPGVRRCYCSQPRKAKTVFLHDKAAALRTTERIRAPREGEPSWSTKNGSIIGVQILVVFDSAPTSRLACRLPRVSAFDICRVGSCICARYIRGYQRPQLAKQYRVEDRYRYS